MTLLKDGNNQTFPEGILKFRNMNAEQHTETGLSGVNIRIHYIILCAGYFGRVVAAD